MGCGQHVRRLGQAVACGIKGPALRARLWRVGCDQTAMRVVGEAAGSDIAVDGEHAPRVVIQILPRPNRSGCNVGSGGRQGVARPFHGLPQP